MALPKLEVPTYKIGLPSTNMKKKIEIRPFLVKEEKIMLMAKQSDDPEEMIHATQKIVQSCVLTKDIDWDKVPIIDYEWILVNIRKRSKGESISVNGVCGKCNTKTPVQVNIDEVKFINIDTKPKIQLSDNIGIMMKFPTFNTIIESAKEDNDSEFDMITKSIEYIYDKESIYRDFTKEEIESWMDDLNDDQLTLIKKFFDNMPKMIKDVDFICQECKHENHFRIEGTQGFFG